MRKYELQVRGANQSQWDEMLKFTSDNMDEVMMIIQLMLKNGHKVMVQAMEEQEEINLPVPAIRLEGDGIKEIQSA